MFKDDPPFSVWTHFLKGLKHTNLLKLDIKVQSAEILLACSQLLSGSHSHEYSTHGTDHYVSSCTSEQQEM